MTPGSEVEILDVSGEIIVIPIKKAKSLGFLRFKRPLHGIMKEYKEEEKKKER